MIAPVGGIEAATSATARSLTAIRINSARWAIVAIVVASAARRFAIGDSERVATPAMGQPIRRHVDPKAHAALPPPMIPRRIQWLSVVGCHLSAADNRQMLTANTQCDK